MARISRKTSDDQPVVIVNGDGEALPEGMEYDTGADFGDPETDSIRKTADIWDQMLGNDSAGTGYVLVHYLMESGGTEVLVMKAPSDKYQYHDLLEVIRTTEAPKLHPGKSGDYRVRLYIKTQRGNFGKKGERLESILASAAPSTALAVSNNGAGLDPAVVAIMRGMREDTQRMAAQIEDMRAGSSGAQIGELMLRALPIVTPLIVAWMSRPKDDPLKSLSTVLGLVGDVRELRDNSPQVGEDAPWYAGALLQALQHLPAVLSGAASVKAAALPGAPGSQMPPAPPIGNAGVGQPAHPFYPQIDALVQVTDRTDPDDVASEVWSGLPPATRPLLVEFLTRKGAFAELAQIHPGVLNDPAWWVDFSDALREWSTGGNTGNSESDGIDQNASGSDTGNNNP
jgi:hypothetical protein